MYQGRTVFSQILDFLPMHKFRQCVNRYNGNKGVETLRVWTNLCVWRLLNSLTAKTCVISSAAAFDERETLSHASKLGILCNPKENQYAFSKIIF